MITFLQIVRFIAASMEWKGSRGESVEKGRNTWIIKGTIWEMGYILYLTLQKGIAPFYTQYNFIGRY